MKYAGILLSVFALALLFGCLGGGQPTSTPTAIATLQPTASVQPTATVIATVTAAPTAAATATPAANTIHIKDYKFTPDKLTVKIGDTVTWINDDVAKHTVTGDPGVTGLDSALIAQGESYAHTFTQKGLYTYHCSPHPYMKASMEVVG